MNILKPSRKDKRYQIRTRGFTMNFNEQLSVHQKMEKLLEKIPSDSKVELRLSKKNFYDAQIIISGSIFGCNLKTSSGSLNILLSNIFRCTDEEIDTWEKTPGYYDEFAPYFGGDPSYYREITF
ncbi:MAG: hypothetical protein VXV96_08825 [Bdellovibrionota bacterium]|nr:hypothetical protein [Bdellovibrionota bacterium]